jgi:glycosyltransferase involved in cell wall biosynthesis
MPTAPLVSVVIPGKDAAPWIGQTLATVLAQTYDVERLEVLVIDDGSTDQTSAVASTLLAPSGRRFQILRNETPAGPGAARNRAWRASAGNWIQFLDADDLLEPSKIAQQAAAVASFDDSVAVAFSPWGRLSATGDNAWERTETIQPFIGDDALRDLLLGGNFLATGSLLFRRTWLERVGGYNPDYTLVEDIDLLMRIVIAGGRLQDVPTPAATFWYRQLPRSLSRENTGAFVRACLRNLKKAETHWRTSGALTVERAEFLADEYFRLGRFFAEHDRRQFAALVDDIYALDPGFVPPWPSSLRNVSRVVGYRRAEHLAIRYRRLKRLLQPAQAS